MPLIKNRSDLKLKKSLISPLLNKTASAIIFLSISHHKHFDMLKPAIVFLMIAQSVSLSAQDKLKVYKLKIDSALATAFDKTLLKYITLTDLLISDGSPDKARFINYSANKDKKIRFATVSFFLEFYSQQLGNKFRFYYKIDKDKNFVPDSSKSIGIPVCLLQNQDCKFISKDSAKTIAVKDSMLYTDNLKIEMIQEYKKEVYYWLLTAKPKTASGSGLPENKAIVRQRRLINAQTGFIQSR